MDSTQLEPRGPRTVLEAAGVSAHSQPHVPPACVFWERCFWKAGLPPTQLEPSVGAPGFPGTYESQGPTPLWSSELYTLRVSYTRLCGSSADSLTTVGSLVGLSGYLYLA